MNSVSLRQNKTNDLPLSTSTSSFNTLMAKISTFHVKLIEHTKILSLTSDFVLLILHVNF
jgi:hypothetical protein